MSEPVVPDACWPVDTACLSTYDDDFPEETRTLAEALAVATLRRLTAYRVGGCPIVVRPCRKNCAESFYSMFNGYGSYSILAPSIIPGGDWINNGCQCDTTECSCGAVCRVQLPNPVGRIDEVKVNGEVIDADNYRVDQRGRLIWVGTTECPFPNCQDLSKEDTEDGTFSVTYLNAYPVDALAAQAAGSLAVEFAKACGTGNKCRLPSGVTSVIRQGVSFDITPGMFTNGQTGLREVDAWIGLWNPNALQQAPRVWSPDIREVSQWH